MSSKLRKFYVIGSGTALGVLALALAFLGAIPSTLYHT